MPLRTPLTSVSLADLSERLTGMGQPAFRADQVARWLYQRTVTEFSQMTDVPASLRAELQDSYALHGLTPGAFASFDRRRDKQAPLRSG